MREEIIATIPQANGETTLEVALVHSDANEAQVELRHMAWGRGLGWIPARQLRQRGLGPKIHGTMLLDAPAAHALLRALGQVRHQLVPGDTTEPARKVIPFPDVSEIPARSKRRAM